MSATASATFANRFIDTLPRDARRRLHADSETVDMVFGTVLCAPDAAMRHVYFPLSGCISLLAAVGGHPPMEMALIGSEGMLGLTFALGSGQEVPLSAVVKCPGKALRMSTSQFRGHVRDSPALLRALQQHLFVLVAQLARTAACTSFHEVEARLARWLLLTHDRAHGDHFHLTHELLADMLGVQRSAVTIAAGTLQKARLISYSRGEIRILDRTGLESMSCECYGAEMAAAAKVRGKGRAAAAAPDPPRTGRNR